MPAATRNNLHRALTASCLPTTLMPADYTTLKPVVYTLTSAVHNNTKACSLHTTQHPDTCFLHSIDTSSQHSTEPSLGQHDRKALGFFFPAFPKG